MPSLFYQHLFFFFELLSNQLFSSMENIINLHLKVLKDSYKTGLTALCESKSYMPDFLIILSIFILKQNGFLSLVKLRLSNHSLTLLKLVLHSALLVNDTPVGQQGHRLPSAEIQKYVVIGDKKHLLNLVQLLEAHDADLA